MFLKSKLEGFVALFEPNVPPQILLPPPVDETGRTILKAADLLRKNGWTRGSYWNSPLGFCVMGAIYMAITGKRTGVPDNHPAIMRVCRHLGVCDHSGVISWNDSQFDSAEMAIAMLEAAARAV
jgi:hypothetical protein